MNEPQKEMLRWNDLVNWLGNYGYSVRSIKKFKEDGKIRPYYYNGKGRAYYIKIQIKKDILNDN